MLTSAELSKLNFTIYLYTSEVIFTQILESQQCLSKKLMFQKWSHDFFFTKKDDSRLCAVKRYIFLYFQTVKNKWQNSIYSDWIRSIFREVQPIVHCCAHCTTFFVFLIFDTMLVSFVKLPICHTTDSHYIQECCSQVITSTTEKT